MFCFFFFSSKIKNLNPFIVTKSQEICPEKEPSSGAQQNYSLRLKVTSVAKIYGKIYANGFVFSKILRASSASAALQKQIDFYIYFSKIFILFSE